MAYHSAITNAGRTLLSAAIAHEATLTFSKIKVGSGLPTAQTDIPNLTALLHYEQDGQIAKNSREGYYEILETIVNNNVVTTGYNLNEIGVYAQSPTDPTQDILYAYIYSPDGDGGRIPAASSVAVKRTIKIYTYVEDVDDALVIIDPSLFVTYEDFNAHLASATAHQALFNNKQDKTNLLTVKSTADASAIMPFYETNNGHGSITITNLLAKLKQLFLPNVAGILKSDGNYNVTAAVGGTDYCTAIQTMTTEDALADSDLVAFYDTSATAHRKTTWSNFVSKLRGLLIGSGTGMLKATNGSVSIATAGTDYQSATNQIPGLTTGFADNDVLPMYDTSASAHKSVTFSNFFSYIKSKCSTSVASGDDKPVTSNGVYEALQNINTDVFYAGTTSPANTKLLWIDTSPETGGLKYYNGIGWVRVPVAYSDVY